MFSLATVKAVVRFSGSPKTVEYVQEGQTAFLKWTYTIGSGYTWVGTIWVSYDPPGSSSVSDQFRLAVIPADGTVVYFPDNKGVNLYEGRVAIKDQATLEITNVTLDNKYLCTVVYKDSIGINKVAVSGHVRVIPTRK